MHAFPINGNRPSDDKSIKSNSIWMNDHSVQNWMIPGYPDIYPGYQSTTFPSDAWGSVGTRRASAFRKLLSACSLICSEFVALTEAIPSFSPIVLRMKLMKFESPGFIAPVLCLPFCFSVVFWIEQNTFYCRSEQVATGSLVSLRLWRRWSSFNWNRHLGLSYDGVYSPCFVFCRFYFVVVFESSRKNSVVEMEQVAIGSCRVPFAGGLSTGEGWRSSSESVGLI